MGYEKYCLSDNPFPRGGAILTPTSDDPRRNGKIFSTEARTTQIDVFEKMFLAKNTVFDDRNTCGFIWAEGGGTIGRGMGKTALAVYMKHKINEDYGGKYFNGKEKIFMTYISFSEQIKSKVEFIYKAILNSLIKDNIFKHLSKCVDMEKLDKFKVRGAFSEAIINGSIEGYLRGLSKYSLTEMRTAYDSKFLTQLPYILLTDTVNALRAGGFSGGIVLIDDMENLTDNSTRKEIQTFIKNMGISFFRSDTETAKCRFFSLVFTTHENSALKISESWNLAGLSSAYPLNPGGRTSILMPKPDVDQCMDIILQHLNHYRIPSFKNDNKYFPFTKEVIEHILDECEYHPRRFLTRLCDIISTALGNDLKEITIDFVKSIPMTAERPESTLGIEDIE